MFVHSKYINSFYTKIALFYVCCEQNQMDPYHETSLTTKNGAHHELEARPCGGGELGLGLGGCGSKDQGLANEQEVFTDPTNCPR